MPGLKTQHILTLSYLLSLGARHRFVPVTSSEIGKSIGRSQQAASAHLLELEQGRFIERAARGRGASVRITPSGYSEMVRVHEELGRSLGSAPGGFELEGTLVSGVGEGAYYMRLGGYTRQFREKVGYVPFPGTLNVRLDRGADAGSLDGPGGVLIDGFSDGQRTYGWVRCLPAVLNGSVGCELVRLERTHHDRSIVELISRVCLREAAGIGDGSRVRICIGT